MWIWIHRRRVDAQRLAEPIFPVKKRLATVRLLATSRARCTQLPVAAHVERSSAGAGARERESDAVGSAIVWQVEKVSGVREPAPGRREVAAGRRRRELPNPAAADAQFICQSEAVVMRVP